MEENLYETLRYNRETAETVGCAGGELAADDGFVRWVDIGSLREPERIRALGEALGVHRLLVEDILTPEQMVKLENYDDCLFLVVKMLRYNAVSRSISSEHISLLLKKGFVLSVSENDADLFAPVRKKILEGRDGIRRSGADTLFYELLDTVVDHYFAVLSALGDEADDIEEELINSPGQETLQRIYFIKRELMFLRKSVYPLRELVGSIINTGSPLLQEGIRIYLHDVYEHLIQTVDSIETYQDILSNMLDTYLSSVSNRTNDTMKILTIISTIFIPLTFLAGIYGMNFKNIPELSLPYGYLLFWILCGIIVVLMALFFHRKKWL